MNLGRNNGDNGMLDYLNNLCGTNTFIDKEKINNMEKNKLEIVIKVCEGKGIILCRSILLCNKPYFVAALLNQKIVLTCLEPRALPDAEALVYSTKELAKLYQEGKLTGLVDIE